MTAKFEDCGMFENCQAPLCPLDPNLSRAVWYADEPICTSRTYGAGLKWIENQRKAKRKAKRDNTFFNFVMLNKNIIIKKGITGIDPDSKDVAGDLKKWIAGHPALSPEQVEQKRQAAHRMRNKKDISKGNKQPEKQIRG